MALPDDLVARLRDVDLDPRFVEDLVRAAIEEDLVGGSDVTTEAVVAAEGVGTAQFVAGAGGVLAGVLVAETAVLCLDEAAEVRRLRDGAFVGDGDVILSVTGSVTSLLTAERTALNLLAHLSGIATLTRHWVNAVTGTKAEIRDSLRTTPILRPLEQFAVRCGGGINHRSSLAECVSITKNHAIAAGGVAAAIKLLKEQPADQPVEVEVGTTEAAMEAVEAGAGALVLHGMSVEDVQDCVDKVDGKATIAVSGELTLSNARAYAETGVDQLVVHSLTQSPRALSISMVLQEVR